LNDPRFTEARLQPENRLGNTPNSFDAIPSDSAQVEALLPDAAAVG
jgi:hypothetical protein